MGDVCDVNFGRDRDENDFYSELPRRARKQHQCAECRSEIQHGETYIRCVGKSDGVMWAVVVCSACREIIREFSPEGWDFGGGIWEDFRDAWSRGTPLQPCLNRLSTVKEKTKLRDMFLKYKRITGMADDVL